MLAPLSKCLSSRQFSLETATSTSTGENAYAHKRSPPPVIPPAWVGNINNCGHTNYTQMPENTRGIDEHPNKTSSYYYSYQQGVHYPQQHESTATNMHQVSTVVIPRSTTRIIPEPHSFTFSQLQRPYTSNQNHDLHQQNTLNSSLGDPISATCPVTLQHNHEVIEKSQHLLQRRPVNIVSSFGPQRGVQISRTSAISPIQRFPTEGNRNPSLPESEMVQLGFNANRVVPPAGLTLSSQPKTPVRPSSIVQVEGQTSPIRAAAEARWNARTTTPAATASTSITGITHYVSFSV